MKHERRVRIQIYLSEKDNRKLIAQAKVDFLTCSQLARYFVQSGLRGSYDATGIHDKETSIRAYHPVRFGQVEGVCRNGARKYGMDPKGNKIAHSTKKGTDKPSKLPKKRKK